jgi:hypothetical protein
LLQSMQDISGEGRLPINASLRTVKITVEEASGTRLSRIDRIPRLVITISFC